jgi:hypothetical protein
MSFMVFTRRFKLVSLSIVDAELTGAHVGTLLIEQSTLHVLSISEDVLSRCPDLGELVGKRVPALYELVIGQVTLTELDAHPLHLVTAKTLFTACINLQVLEMPLRSHNLALNDLFMVLGSLHGLRRLTLRIIGPTTRTDKAEHVAFPLLQELVLCVKTNEWLKQDVLAWMAACFWPQLVHVDMQRGELRCSLLADWLNSAPQLRVFKYQAQELCVVDEFVVPRGDGDHCIGQHHPYQPGAITRQDVYTLASVVQCGFLGCTQWHW